MLIWKDTTTSIAVQKEAGPVSIASWQLNGRRIIGERDRREDPSAPADRYCVLWHQDLASDVFGADLALTVLTLAPFFLAEVALGLGLYSSSSSDSFVISDVLS